ncbi:MAG TPA: peptidylprolyl isomerase [Gemmatales bacterium]|nr:peptidylprolyl isomerase [Gemmatales bacterium]
MSQFINNITNPNTNYNGLIFHRVIQGFVAQGGDPNGNGTGGFGGKFDDEFHASLTFNSFGLLAMANAGDDDNESQFFITDTSSVANFPQHLNFNHNIFGQLVDGLDVFQRIMNTPVTNDRPNSNVVINHVQVINSNKYAILELSSNSTFTGSGNITVSATNARNQTNSRTVSITVQPDAVNGVPTNDRPFLNVANLRDTQINKNTSLTFDVSATDLENDNLLFVVRRENFTELTPADNVTVNIVKLNNTTARVTITPDADFTGLLNLKFGVTQVLNNPTQADFDTQRFNLLVTENPVAPTDLSLVTSSFINAGNVTTTDTPTIELKAPTGATVKILNGITEIGTATETNTPGVYRFTFPSGKLMLGQNNIQAISQIDGFDSLLSKVLNITFAPLQQQIYVVPGALGEQVQIRFDFLQSVTRNRNEAGVYVVDDLSGSVNGVAPGASNYWSTVATHGNRVVLFSRLAGGSVAPKTLTFTAGTKLAFYVSANRAFNPAARGALFGSIREANIDGRFYNEHFTDRSTGRAIYGFEDTRGGDRDFNDMVFSVRSIATNPAVGALKVDLAGAGQPVKANFAMLPTLNSRYRPMGGEIGIFEVLDAQGTIAAPLPNNPNRTLKPGDVGYAQAALSQASRQTLFTQGDIPGERTRTLNLASGTQFGIYYIPRGTANFFLNNNPANTIAAGRPLAYFSFAAANPVSGQEHMRSYGREAASRTHTGLLPTLNDPVRIHMMGVARGNTNNFSDFILTYSQTL